MENLSVVVGSGVEMDLQCSMLKRFRILSMYRDCESDICPSLVFLLTFVPSFEVLLQCWWVLRDRYGDCLGRGSRCVAIIKIAKVTFQFVEFFIDVK